MVGYESAVEMLCKQLQIGLNCRLNGDVWCPPPLNVPGSMRAIINDLALPPELLSAIKYIPNRRSLCVNSLLASLSDSYDSEPTEDYDNVLWNQSSVGVGHFLGGNSPRRVLNSHSRCRFSTSSYDTKSKYRTASTAPVYIVVKKSKSSGRNPKSFVSSFSHDRTKELKRQTHRNPKSADNTCSATYGATSNSTKSQMKALLTSTRINESPCKGLSDSKRIRRCKYASEFIESRLFFSIRPDRAHKIRNRIRSNNHNSAINFNLPWPVSGDLHCLRHNDRYVSFVKQASAKSSHLKRTIPTVPPFFNDNVEAKLLRKEMSVQCCESEFPLKDRSACGEGLGASNDTAQPYHSINAASTNPTTFKDAALQTSLDNAEDELSVSACTKGHVLPEDCCDFANQERATQTEVRLINGNDASYGYESRVMEPGVSFSVSESALLPQNTSMVMQPCIIRSTPTLPSRIPNSMSNDTILIGGNIIQYCDQPDGPSPHFDSSTEPKQTGRDDATCQSQPLLSNNTSDVASCNSHSSRSSQSHQECYDQDDKEDSVDVLLPGEVIVGDSAQCLQPNAEFTAHTECLHSCDMKTHTTSVSVDNQIAGADSPSSISCLLLGQNRKLVTSGENLSGKILVDGCFQRSSSSKAKCYNIGQNGTINTPIDTDVFYLDDLRMSNENFSSGAGEPLDKRRVYNNHSNSLSNVGSHASETLHAMESALPLLGEKTVRFESAVDCVVISNSNSSYLESTGDDSTGSENSVSSPCSDSNQCSPITPYKVYRLQLENVWRMLNEYAS